MATDYGIDVSTFPDLDPTFGLISGPRVVAENVARRLEEALHGVLNADLSPTELRSIEASARRIASEDERVFDAVASATLAGRSLTVSVRLTLIEGETFTLVLAVGSVSVEILIT